jgi:hypothetical protein
MYLLMFQAFMASGLVVFPVYCRRYRSKGSIAVANLRATVLLCRLCSVSMCVSQFLGLRWMLSSFLLSRVEQVELLVI